MNIITEDHSKECSEEDVLFVGRLGGYIKERDLMQHFNRYGKIRSVHLVRDGYGFSKGYGFVNFYSKNVVKSLLERDPSRNIVIRNRRIFIGHAKRRLNLKQREASSEEMFHQNNHVPGSSRDTNCSEASDLALRGNDAPSSNIASVDEDINNSPPYSECKDNTNVIKASSVSSKQEHTIDYPQNREHLQPIYLPFVQIPVLPTLPILYQDTNNGLFYMSSPVYRPIVSNCCGNNHLLNNHDWATSASPIYSQTCMPTYHVNIHSQPLISTVATGRAYMNGNPLNAGLFFNL